MKVGGDDQPAYKEYPAKWMTGEIIESFDEGTKLSSLEICHSYVI